jgi:3'-5' exoribonuclease
VTLFSARGIRSGTHQDPDRNCQPGNTHQYLKPLYLHCYIPQFKAGIQQIIVFIKNLIIFNNYLLKSLTSRQNWCFKEHQDMETLSITELRAQADANPGQYAVHAQVAALAAKQTRTGKPYFEIALADSAGEIKIKIWQDAPGFARAESLQEEDWVMASAFWSFNDYGLDARDCELQSLQEEDIAAVLAGDEATRAKQAEDYDYIEASCSELTDPRFRAVCGLFLEKFGERFKRSGGARHLHHARRGGLVEHVAQMMRCSKAICSVYSNLNQDLMVAGVLFHDCGKMWENNYPEKGFKMPYDFTAELMGHISFGVELANSLWKEAENESGADWKTMEPTSDKARLHLIHLILSHHGTHEFGSPVLPKTPEAMALHHVDNIDAKLEMFATGYLEQETLAPGVQKKVWALNANIVQPLGNAGEE